MFSNLFSEAEAFAAILIAYRTHVLSGGTPEARRVKIRGRRLRVGKSSWGRGSEPPPYQQGGLGERCKLSQWGLGSAPSGVWDGAPTTNTFSTY